MSGGILMAQANPARLVEGRFHVDRKFLVGMQRYAEQISRPMLTVHPEATAESRIMDSVEVPCSELPFDVMTVRVDGWGRTAGTDVARLRYAISKSALVYGMGLGAPQLALALGVPYILVLENDLRTRIVLATSQTASPLRRASRAARCAWRHITIDVPEMRRAHSLHCNGYPVYDATRAHNSRRLLYLDSRMSEDMLITPEELTARLATRPGRPLRLLYSGRYERMKGVDEAVTVGLECLRRGLDIEMHFYGEGSLRDEMERLSQTGQRPGRIHIHESVPFPQLVKIARTFDLFVCCHIQSDPSCTYLESLGAGLPIVGYDNRMWSRLCRDSGAGLSSRLGLPAGVVDDIHRLASDHETLVTMSVKALEFARQHCYEREFSKRIESLNSALAAGQAATLTQ